MQIVEDFGPYSEELLNRQWPVSEEQRLANGPYALYRTYEELDVVTVNVDPQLVADVDTPDELVSLP